MTGQKENRNKMCTFTQKETVETTQSSGFGESDTHRLYRRQERQM